MIPTQHTAGDVQPFRLELPDHPPGADRAVRLALQGPTDQTIDAAADGTGWLLSLPATLPAGHYAFALAAFLSGARQTLQTGLLHVLPDPFAASPAVLDRRSHALRMVSAIEAVLERRASKDENGYEVEGMRLDRHSVDDLLRLLRKYRREVRRETRRAADQPVRVDHVRYRLKG